MLATDREFVWPNAPSANGDGFVDLRQPFVAPKAHYSLPRSQLKPNREFAYTLAVNWKTRLGVGLFSEDPIWLAIWEENRARTQCPVEQDNPGAWHGSLALPPCPLVGKKMHGADHCLQARTNASSPATGNERPRILCFSFFTLPPLVTAIEDVEVDTDFVTLYDQDNQQVLTMRARGCGAFLAPRSCLLQRLHE